MYVVVLVEDQEVVDVAEEEVVVVEAEEEVLHVEGEDEDEDEIDFFFVILWEIYS
jgi:hypothetical protein